MALHPHAALRAPTRTQALVVLVGAIGVVSSLAPSCKPADDQRDKRACVAPADGGLTYDEFWYCVAETFCTALVDCKSAEPSVVDPCISYLTRMSRDGYDRARLAVGAARYDPVAAAACLAAFREQTPACSPPAMPEAPACNQILTPISIETGARCAPGASCRETTDLCAGAACEETCRPAGGLGQPCLNGNCSTGSYCNTTTQTCTAQLPAGSPCRFNECDSSSYCTAVGDSGWDAGYSCRPYVPVGGACRSTECGPAAYCGVSNTCATRKVSGSTCAATPECEGQLRCIRGRCTAPSGEDEPCSGPEDCADSRVCDSVLRTCKGLRRVTQEGEACTGHALTCAPTYDPDYEPMPRCVGVATNSDGGVGTPGTCRWPQLGDACTTARDCPLGSFCAQPDAGAAGVCRSTTLGTPCDLKFACPPGLACSPQRSCQPQVARGGACTETPQCAPGLACKADPADGRLTCDELGSAGAPCRGTWGQCKLPNLCIDDVCTPGMTVGAPCEGTCFTGFCRPRSSEAGSRGTCEPYLPDGAECHMHSECTSDSCVNGVCVVDCR